MRYKSLNWFSFDEFSCFPKCSRENLSKIYRSVKHPSFITTIYRDAIASNINLNAIVMHSNAPEGCSYTRTCNVHVHNTPILNALDIWEHSMNLISNKRMNITKNIQVKYASGQPADKICSNFPEPMVIRLFLPSYILVPSYGRKLHCMAARSYVFCRFFFSFIFYCL